MATQSDGAKRIMVGIEELKAHYQSIAKLYLQLPGSEKEQREFKELGRLLEDCENATRLWLWQQCKEKYRGPGQAFGTQLADPRSNKRGFCSTAVPTLYFVYAKRLKILKYSVIKIL